jgi:hypothetical protein
LQQALAGLDSTIDVKRAKRWVNRNKRIALVYHQWFHNAFKFPSLCTSLHWLSVKQLPVHLVGWSHVTCFYCRGFMSGTEICPSFWYMQNNLTSIVSLWFQNIGQQAVSTAFTSSKAAVYLWAWEKCDSLTGIFYNHMYWCSGSKFYAKYTAFCWQLDL